MVKSAWFIIVTILVFLIEIIFCNWDLLLPGALFICFYFSVTFGMAYGLIPGAVVCIFIEFFHGRQTTVLPLLLLIIFYSKFWRNLGDRRSLLPQCFSGSIISILYYIFCIQGENLNPAVPVFFNISAFFQPILFTVIVSAAGFPTLIFILDLISKNIGLETFRMQSKI